MRLVLSDLVVALIPVLTSFRHQHLDCPQRALAARRHISFRRNIASRILQYCADLNTVAKPHFDLTVVDRANRRISVVSGYVKRRRCLQVCDTC